MKVYRRLAPFSAISFDLDDTLYANREVMMATERSMLVFFEQLLAVHHSHNQRFDRHFWWPFRTDIIAQQPLLAHDVTELRRQTYRQGIMSLGVEYAEASQLADKALAHFIAQRSQFTVPKSVHELMERLAEKYPLVAISNGNVDAKAIGIDHYFQHIFHAGDGKKMKPAQDMFALAAEKLQLPLARILHVGDCGHADVFGALRAGMQSVWLSCYDVGKPLRTLPHVEITDIAQIERLV